MGNCAGRIYHSRNVVNLCIDTYDEEKQCGELWSQYLGGPAAFTSLFEALEKMEDLYDALQYPLRHAAFCRRAAESDAAGGSV